MPRVGDAVITTMQESITAALMRSAAKCLAPYFTQDRDSARPTPCAGSPRSRWRPATSLVWMASKRGASGLLFARG